MATLKATMPDDLMIGLERLSNQIDSVVEKTLEAGAEIVEDKMRSNLKSVIGSGTKTESKSTGQLLSALGTSPVKPNRNIDGWDIKVGFNEPRENDFEKLKSTRFRVNPLRAHASYNLSRREKKAAGIKLRNYSYYVTTNAMIANVLEYGKKGQAAKPFMKPAVDATKAKVRSEMRRVFTEEAHKIIK